jgi:hypothetical protein
MSQEISRFLQSHTDAATNRLLFIEHMKGGIDLAAFRFLQLKLHIA